ncbi:MAG: hypothetical protein LBR66_08165 [Candidatus Symbiothrix sp.]|jgi:hypothetical protein|nr:hypothetical protein [Candidatus Symbiothrix sp.]
MYKKSFLSVVLFGLLLAFSVGNASAQSSNEDKKMAKMILESFCQDFYGSCFSGRSYVENSLYVTRVEDASLNQKKVYGFHSYKGRWGTLYEDYEFQAYIKITPTSITIKFHKKSAPDLFHSDYYWETCEKTIHIDD